jgi:maltose O-acetyltransferase
LPKGVGRMRLNQTGILLLERIGAGLRRRIRRAYYARTLRKIGRNCQICDGVMIAGPENVSIGNNVAINNRVIIQSCEDAEIMIGDDVTLSYGAQIITGGYAIGSSGIDRNRHIGRSIILEEKAWIGAGAVLLGGIRIGKNAIVAAGSVVTKNVKAGAVVAGNPAKEMRRCEEI